MATLIFFPPSNDKVGHTMYLIFYFRFFHLFLVYHGKKKFQKTIRHTNSIQTKSPQTETLRTFDILHDDSIPFANVERFQQKWVFTGWKLKTKTSPLLGHTHTETQTSMHTQTCITSRHVDPQRVCGDVQMWRTCLQATTRIIHTRTLFLYFSCTDYTVNVCVTIYINTASWIIHLITITVFHTSTSLWHHYYIAFLPNKFPAWCKLVLFV